MPVGLSCDCQGATVAAASPLTPPRAPAPAPPGGTLFEPQITQAAAVRRHAKWKKAVERSFALADLTRDLEEDSEPRQPGAAAERGGGGGKVAPEPQGPED